MYMAQIGMGKQQMDYINFFICVFGYLCYIKIYSKKKIKVEQKNINPVNLNSTISYLYVKSIV